MRTTLLPIHIAAGLIAIVAGFVALLVPKGAAMHRKSGRVFVYAMLVMGGTGAVVALLKPDPGTAMGGVLSAYLVITGLLAFRRSAASAQWTDAGAMLLGLGVALVDITFGFEAAYSVTGRKYGYVPAPFFVFGGVALLAVIGDLRMMVSGIQGTRRLARHLWRMSFATFVASASFFLGQAKVIPKPVRIMPLLAIPALLPLALMFYWLGRVWLTNRTSRRVRTPRANVVQALQPQSTR